MFAILAEDESDADALAQLVKRYFNNNQLSVKKKGYDGCGGLCRKGARDIKSWMAQGISRFVICHDADFNSSATIREKVLKSVVRPAAAQQNCCVAIPIQEIEAWLIADETAITKVIPTFRFKGHPNPERIPSPKEWLIDQSEAENGKPLYAPKTFNAAVAMHIRFEVVEKKCPSFKAFVDCLGVPKTA